jgi:uncharacterized membrane protein
MAWIGLIVGIVFGASLGGVPGALALGFLGWLGGFIFAAATKPKEPVTISQPAAQRPDPSVYNRLAKIENRLAAIEAKLGIAPEAAKPATPAVPAPGEQAPAGPVRTVSGSLDTSGADLSRTGEWGTAPPAMAAASEALTAAEAAALDAPPRLDAHGNDITRPSRKAPPPPPREPDTPNPIVAWFLGGNTIVRVGLVVLFIGLAFLVKYGVEHQLIPVELRVAAVGAAGIALLIVGWRLRHKPDREGYALSLQGAGVAVLYLTIFGALKLYHLIPPTGAFLMLVMVAALGSMLAIKQDSLVFAIFALAGGFLAPILASTGTGSHVLLFSYYVLLNASIVLMAWYKAWRALNVVGFVFTALIGLAWGERSYRPELFDSTEPFLVVFFLMYLAIAILFARRQTDTTTNQAAVDGTIVFGNPIFAFGLQAGIMKGLEFGLAFSSVVAAAIYLLLTWVLKRTQNERWHFLSECFLALGVVFATLAIPLALDARWTSAAWALEGAAIVWAGVRQRRKLARAFGVLLQLGAGASFFLAQPMPPGPPLADATFIGALVIAAGGLLTYRMLQRDEADMSGERTLSTLFFAWSVGWLLIAGAHEIHTQVAVAYRHTAWVAFLGALSAIFLTLALRRGWTEGRYVGFMLPPILIGMALFDMLLRSHPFADFGWLAWPFTLAVLVLVLKRGYPDARLAVLLHVMTVALVALVGALEIEWFAVDNTAPGTAWALASRIVAPSIVLLLISSKFADDRWPVSEHLATYRVGAATLLVIAMALWSLHVNWAHAGGSEPLPYFPLLNALDLAHILGWIAVISAILAARRSELPRPEFLTPQLAWTVAGAVAFIWANSMLLRTIHHWAGVPYRADALWRSVLVQASLSIFWAVLALSLMVYATRRALRPVWMVGAALMAVVVLKLVIVDLGHLSGIERIVSFIGVGVLMLVIGYFSPVPPRTQEAA